LELNAVLEKTLVTPALAKNLTLYSEYVEDVLRSSGEWLLAEAKFQEWMDRKSPLLWVAGGPGTGKSYLSAITISKLTTTYPQDPTHPSRISVAFFYVKEHDQDLQDLGNMLKSIAYQIARVDPVFMSHVISVLSKPEGILSPRKIWETIFLSFFGPTRQIANSAMIVLDGLDEAPKKTIRDLFRCLESLSDLNWSGPRLSFALFGRPELAEYITTKLRRSISSIEIGEKNEVDIGLYIKQHVTEILVVRETMKLKSKKAASRLARDIRDKLMAKADGMFFKVVLIMNQLYDKERISSMFEAIEDSPPQLEAMIRHVFDRLACNQDVDKEDLNEILVWVAYSKRPLLLVELYVILKQRTGQAYDALEARLRGKFASLFKLSRKEQSRELQQDEVSDTNVIDEDDNLDIDLFSDDDETAEGNDETVECGTDKPETVEDEELNSNAFKHFWTIDVRYTHASIRDFLMTDGDPELSVYSSNTGIGIKTQTAQMHLASICIQTILDWDVAEKDWSIITYSAQYFMDHLLSIEACRISKHDKQPLIRQLCQLFFNETGLRKLIMITEWDYNKALHMWFETTHFSTSIRRNWLAHAQDDQFTPEEYEWLNKAANSRREFFLPLAVQASRMWLTKLGHDDMSYCDDRYQLYQVWIVHSYLSLVSDTLLV
jgi:hypothetical protein